MLWTLIRFCNVAHKKMIIYTPPGLGASPLQGSPPPPPPPQNLLGFVFLDGETHCRGKISKTIRTRNERAKSQTLRPGQNDRNMPIRHIATLLGATCYVRLVSLLRRVGCCLNWSNLSQQHPTRRNMSQQGGQTHATRCAQQCCDVLRWHVAIVWPGLQTSLL